MKRTTGIGSLPYLDLQTGLDAAFQCDIPYIPELPRRDPSNGMLELALKSIHEIETFLPFVERFKRGNYPFAKIQIAGPITLGYEERVIERALERAVFLMEKGIQVLLFFDEPGLHKNKADLTLLEKGIRLLKAKNILTGVHCCGEGPWKELMKMGLDYLSLDVRLSLESVIHCNHGLAFKEFVKNGGRLACGVISCGADLHLESIQEFQIPHQILRECLFTPTCGTALCTIEQSELIFKRLREI